MTDTTRDRNRALEAVAEQAYWLLLWTYQSYAVKSWPPLDMTAFDPDAYGLMNRSEQQLYDALVHLSATPERREAE